MRWPACLPACFHSLGGVPASCLACLPRWHRTFTCCACLSSALASLTVYPPACHASAGPAGLHLPRTAAVTCPFTCPFTCPACSKDPGLLESVVAGLTDLLRSGSDSAGQASARAIKNLSAGHTNSNKVRCCYGAALPVGCLPAGAGLAGLLHIKQRALATRAGLPLLPLKLVPLPCLHPDKHDGMLSSPALFCRPAPRAGEDCGFGGGAAAGAPAGFTQGCHTQGSGLRWASCSQALAAGMVHPVFSMHS